MLGHTRGKRSAVTCALKCDNACSKAVCNTSTNSYFRDIVSAEFSRRTALGVGAAGALGAAVLALGGAAPAAAAPAGPGGGRGPGKSLGFAPIAPVDAAVDSLDVPEGYDWEPLLRWGDPLFTDSPEFNFGAQNAAAQARQFGYNNDYLEILRQPNGKKGLLVCNHEYVNPEIMFPAAPASAAEEAERRAIFRNAVGMSVVELERGSRGTPWKYVRGARLNRRITLDTVFELTGPAAGTELLKTAADPEGRFVFGTLGNCAGGSTPWGTVLSGEENFNGFFRTGGTSAEDRRYGLGSDATAMGWEQEDPRFDARTPETRNEPNRFGYIVELDPEDPDSVPRKHTSLGRFKHEGANVIIARNGKAVAYSGDDERFDYLYKFVSKNKYRKNDKRHNMTLLGEGDLYVARFEGNSPESEIDGTGAVPADGGFDGRGTWLPLVVRGKSAIPGMSVAEVLVYTRLAADKAGATKMDRCEDVEPSLATGRVYVACTNNSNRGVGANAAADEVNPRRENRDGHIVEIIEDRDDATATSFRWNLLMLCGDPAQGDATYFSGYPQELVSPISCPDNLAFDSTGNLWISTDGAPSGIGYNDGLFKVALAGRDRGKVEQFLSVPRDGETCGPVIHDEESMVFVAVQHPGEDGSYGAHTSFFPDYVPDGAPPAAGEVRAPRPAVVQVYREEANPGRPGHKGRGKKGRR
ncbi:PhoX family protein [Arthrobacter gengyunqii]|uniref:PhoX family phosphatase n=1 Tax=Arthrobacter gengyunqii TaxID=2886940 RepID=A0ABS8GG25_9MICC|nr:PhoX family phosphatase [Arthrobacter gengyunqii]MCC3265587.1 PhoX family phosphatase [Arthrobacter gengyunqii]